MAITFASIKTKVFNGVLNTVTSLLMKYMYKGGVVVKITFAQGSSISEVEVGPEDINVIGDKFLALVQTVSRDPSAITAVGQVLGAIAAAVAK